VKQRKANKKPLSLVATMNEKRQGAAKEAARNAQRRERAELKLLDTASSFKSMQHLTNVELTQARLQVTGSPKLCRGTISYNAKTARSNASSRATDVLTQSVGQRQKREGLTLLVAVVRLQGLSLAL
jgi:hypothetical protein